MLSGAMMRAVRGRLLRVRHLSDWGRSRSAMASVFGFDLPHHLFRAVPVNWVQLTEPQATKAFANFLNADDRTVRSKRIQAFLRVLGSRCGGPNADPRKARATSEAPAAEKKRIDLLLEWEDPTGLGRGAVIEAKFGHRIVNGTLPKYRKHLQKIERQYRRTEPAPQDKPLLFVISSRLRDHDKKALRRNKGWRWMSWRSLLLAYDRALDPHHDDDEFRQFRRTLWDRASS